MQEEKKKKLIYLHISGKLPLINPVECDFSRRSQAADEFFM